MKNENDFRQYYETNLLSYLKVFDKKRQILMKIRIANWLMFLALFPAGYFIFMYNQNQPLLLLVLLPVIGFMIYIGIQRHKKKKVFRDEYKNNVIKKIVQFIDTDLQFEYKNRISNQEFYQSKIYTHRADRSKGEDLIYGKLGETKVKFSELHLEYKTTSTDSNGNTRTQWHTIFRGVFFIADFNKHFQTETIVLPDMLEGILGKFARKLQNIGKPKGKKLIQLENPEFEKYFRVYADDSIESRYILTPAMMERIVNFRKTTKIRLSLSFVDSNIYMALPITKDLFEPRIFKNNYDFEFIKESFSYLLLFTGIVEELNLNTRIWTKQ